MDGKTRKNLKPGMQVFIVLKKDQRSGTLTKGVIKQLLTKSPNHPHGIKVRLEDGQVGRVKEILTHKPAPQH
ncbi:MAG: YwbE family protein [Pseudodesulfovibrio sp.]|nr:YwbE family protein [Pseudodesulfovibrio sp.]